MSVPIELQVGDPPRTIYEDIVNLPETVKLGITIRAFNHDDVGLYFQVTAECSGWTFETESLGLIGTGADIYKNLDEFGSRAKPASETEQIIKLILKAYTDAGYTDLKWTYERNVTIVFIKSDDASYTVDELDNFDDGTVQGWAVASIYNSEAGYPQIGVATDYVLSPSYSLKSLGQGASLAYPMGFRIYKSFTTPNKTNIYAIIDLRIGATDPATYINALRLLRDAIVLVHLGGEWVDWTVKRTVDYLPKDKWIRIVVPLPKNVTIEVGIETQWTQTLLPKDAIVWMDDFKIISK